MTNFPVKLYKAPDLKNPSMVAAWPGMGDVALGAVSYLREKLGADEFGEIEPGDFFDLAGVIIENGVMEAPQFPESKFYYWKSQDATRDLIIFLGHAQPSAKGYEFANKVLDVAQRFSVKRIYTCAAAPASIHHTEKPRVLAVANETRLKRDLQKYEVVLMKNGQISGLNGLLLGVAKERGIEGICLLGEIPFYTVGIPNSWASQAVLEILIDMLGIRIDMMEIELVAKETVAEIDEMVRSSEQMSKFVGRFEPSARREELGGPSQSVEDEIRVRHRIERLFGEAEKDRSKVGELKTELDRLGVFEEYEDRFLDLFRKGNQ